MSVNKEKIGIPNGLKESLKYHHQKRDKKENKETKIPVDEKISLKCLWVFEAYTPNYINNLINGIDKIKWDSPHLEENNSEIIRKIREGSSYTWYNLGLIESKRKEKDNKESQLPQDVDFAYGSIFQYLSSITILSIQFIFNNEISNNIESVINKEYKTYLKKIEKGYRYVTPFFQKESEVIRIKEQVYNRCYEWFKKYLPGLYSDELTDVKFPTCEFLTLKEGIPFKNKNKFSDYKNVLDISSRFNVWKSDELKGLYIEFPNSRKSDFYLDFTKLKIVGNLNEILSDINLKPYSGLKNHEIELYLSDFNRSLIIWGYYVLMKTVKCNLIRIRDTISSISIENIFRSTNKIQDIRKKFILLDRNVSYFMNELANFDNRILSMNVVKFKTLEEYPFNKDLELFKNIFEITKEETNIMANEYRNIRQDIETTSNIILSIMNGIIYRINIAIGLVMLILTILLIVITTLMIK